MAQKVSYGDEAENRAEPTWITLEGSSQVLRVPAGRVYLKRPGKNPESEHQGLAIGIAETKHFLGRSDV
jgi:hypothetical protein